ncbi:hypothetical protein AaE_002852 [Aphanomyces astaci]|uniref:Core-binding (CB) domain-containing protein n=1 Tax=Aphanomyces astaci TaxID=112090 RepID=A0A6A5A8P3_APHAT|nr:hypothetical protein AaE_002852 [Aphanomyces astaci]
MSKKRGVEAASLVEGDAGDHIMQLRVVERTRSQYSTMLAHFQRWLIHNNPDLVKNNSICLPIPPGVCQAYLTFVSTKRDAQGNELVPQLHNSYSTINGYKSAIKFLNSERKCDASVELELTLKQFAKGYKRHVAQLKEDGEIPMREGKCPMPKEGYMFLAMVAASNGTNCAHYAYVHCFLLFAWNLIARAASVSSIRFDHISWEG